jgi:hypothetical protein
VLLHNHAPSTASNAAAYCHLFPPPAPTASCLRNAFHRIASSALSQASHAILGP